jgi:hypothetical protein
MFVEEELWAEESNLETRQKVPLTFENGNSSGVVQNLVSEATLLASNQLPCNSIHCEWNIEVNQGSRDKIVFAGADWL